MSSEMVWDHYIGAWHIITKDLHFVCDDNFLNALLTKDISDKPAEQVKKKVKKPYYRRGRWE